MQITKDLDPAQRVVGIDRASHETMTVKKPETVSERRGAKAAERRALLIAYAFQSPWADKHLPPDPVSKHPAEWQRQYQFGLAAERVARHLCFEIAFDDSDLHRLWRQAAILHASGPFAFSEDEADFMRSAVLDIELSAKLHRARRSNQR